MNRLKNLVFAGIFAFAIGVVGCADERANDVAENKAAETTESTEMAEKSEAPTTGEDQANVIRVSVPTMVCEGCTSTISDACKSVEGTKEVRVDVKEKAAFVTVANNTPDMQKELEMAITKAGYSTENMERNAEAFEKLAECCKVGHDEDKKEDKADAETKEM